MSFSFIEERPKTGSYPRAYRIDFGNREYTAWDFISEVLFEHECDWGFIKFVNMGGACQFMLYYRYSELLIPIPCDISSWVVVKANVEGEQTRMDYTVTVKTPEDFGFYDLVKTLDIFKQYPAQVIHGVNAFVRGHNGRLSYAEPIWKILPIFMNTTESQFLQFRDCSFDVAEIMVKIQTELAKIAKEKGWKY